MPRRPFLLTSFAITLITMGPASALALESGSFVDDDNNRYESYIERAAAEGILAGCNPPDNDMICPDRQVTRGEMAIMLARAINIAPGENDGFVDTEGHAAEMATSALAAAGISNGCGEERFCPNRPLSRGEMATLIVNAMGWEPRSTTHPYRDLEDGPHGVALATLALRGGAEACDAPVGLRLCPDRMVTRAEAAYALVSALGLGVSPRPLEEPERPSLGFSDNFESLNLWDGRAPSSRNRVALTDRGYEGTGLRVRIPKGSHYGADFRLPLNKEFGGEPELLFFRYMLRLDPNWHTRSSGKLPGFSGVYGSSGKGGYKSTPSSPGWSARVQFFPTRGNEPRVRLGYYVYHLGQERRYGDGMAWNEAANLVPGDWYCIEGEIRLNSPGLSDGALRAWVDDTPAFDASGLEFRRPDEPDIRIESFWFNVYHGGKTVPDRTLGLTVDRVAVGNERIGCDVGEGVARPVEGDFRGTGFTDHLAWDACPGGSCFQLLTQTTSGQRGVIDLGDGAWFSLETHRLGMASGDLTGDGRDELVYWGRCAGSTPCWRVHRTQAEAWSIGANWGGDAWYPTSTDSFVVGDWDGDGMADLAYDGLCGSEAQSCWRVHRSLGDRFEEPSGWGAPPEGSISFLSAADVTGNGRDDLVYKAPCGEETCWFTQLSLGSGFAEPLPLGRVLGSETEWSVLFDWDGDGRADLVSIDTTDDLHEITVRLMAPDGLGVPVTVAQFSRPVTDLRLGRRSDLGPVHALVGTACVEGSTCVEHRLARTMALLTPSEYLDVIVPRSVIASV